MNSKKKDLNVLARRYGFRRIGISTPDENWQFLNDNVINDANPMPCSEADSPKDIPYLKTIFKYIESNPDQFDWSKVYAHGGSQNSVWSSVIGNCFQTRGVWLGASGLSVKGQELYPPSCTPHVKKSVLNQCKAEKTNCEQCAQKYPCEECQYWPIYPCYTPKRPMINCLQDYYNDFYTNSKEDPENVSSINNMYEAMMREGHDVRLLRFEKSDDGTITGGHHGRTILQNSDLKSAFGN